jgi:hypothetical protein
LRHVKSGRGRETFSLFTHPLSLPSRGGCFA